MKAAIYTRLSRDREDQTSTARQERDARRLAKTKEWKVTDVFTDVDFSAYSGIRRPAYEQLLEAVEAGAVDAVIVWKIDRLARSLVEFVRFAAACQRHDVALVSVHEPIDTSTPFGRALVQILAVFAELESATIGLRVKAARDQEAKAGRPHSGGQRRFGYTRAMEVNPVEAALVREAYDHVLAGRSVGTLARRWNAAGITSPTGRTWTVKSLVGVLRSPHLAALRQHQGDVVATGTWAPIVSPDDHAAVTEALTRRPRGPAVRRFLLSGGLARCGREGCGASLHSYSVRGGVGGYRCPNLPGVAGCGKLSVVAGPLEDRVTELLFQALDSPEFLAALDGGPVDDAEVTALAARLERVRATEELLDPEDYRTLTSTLERELADARARAARRHRRGRFAELPTGREALRMWWDEADLEQRRTLLAAVIDHVVVAPAGEIRHRFDPARVPAGNVVWRA
jgi:DNA invertase Pin-like site-specific DNA recombinase